MTENEKKMLSLGCPECAGDIELYDTNKDGSGGKYKCLKCHRDTSWAVGKTESILDVLKRVKHRENSKPYLKVLSKLNI